MKRVIVFLLMGFALLACLSACDTRVSYSDIYHYTPTEPLCKTGKAVDLEYWSESGGGFTARGISDKASIPSSGIIDIRTGKITKLIYCPDALGSQNIHILIKDLGYTDYAGLRFKDEVVLNIREDGSIEADREGIEAVDVQRSNTTWISRKVKSEDSSTPVILMVRKDSRAARAVKPSKTPKPSLTYTSTVTMPPTSTPPPTLTPLPSATPSLTPKPLPSILICRRVTTAFLTSSSQLPPGTYGLWGSSATGSQSFEAVQVQIAGDPENAVHSREALNPIMTSWEGELVMKFVYKDHWNSDQASNPYALEAELYYAAPELRLLHYRISVTGGKIGTKPQTCDASVIEPFSSTPSVKLPAGWKLIQFDTFDLNPSKWFTGSLSLGDYWETNTFRIKDGVYRFEGRAKQGVTSYVLSKAAYQFDFHLSMYLRQVSGPEDGQAGLFFRQFGDDYYRFLIAPSIQEFTFDAWVGGEWKTILPNTYSAAIKRKGWNRLEVYAVGSEFVFWINGVQVARAKDSSINYGTPALGVQLNNQGDEAVFEFDNYEIWAPDK